MKNKTIKIIKAILNKEKNIEFAYLFGSFISEKKHNDIDIGIYTHEGIKENSLNITANLKHKISRKLKESNIHLEADEIDITLLNSINFKFMARIFKEGVLILDKNPEHRADLMEENSLKLRECMGILKEAEIL